MEISSIIISPILAAIIAIIIAYVTTIKSISFELGKTIAKIDSIDKRMDKFEDRFDKFVLASSTGEGKNPPELDPYLDRFEKAVKKLESTQKKNPLSGSEIERMKIYRNKMGKGEPFSLEEYKEFKSTADKMREELPAKERDDFDKIIAGLSGYIAGLLFSASVKKRERI